MRLPGARGLTTDVSDLGCLESPSVVFDQRFMSTYYFYRDLYFVRRDRVYC